jgi:hypothetical protein
MSGRLALASDSLVASNLWQARELDAKFMRDFPTLPEARDFHDRYLSARRSIPEPLGRRRLGTVPYEVPVLSCENRPYGIKAGPADGSLRRPSSAGSHGRAEEPTVLFGAPSLAKMTGQPRAPVTDVGQPQNG